jgi:hypothetical protein
MIFRFLFNPINSNWENTKRYSDFVGLVVRMTFCFSIGSYLFQTENQILFFGFKYVAAIIFILMGMVFIPLIEDRMDEAFPSWVKKTNSKFVIFVQKMVLIFIPLIILFSVLFGSMSFVGENFK